MSTGLAVLALLIIGGALLRASLGALSLWWCRRQAPAPKPGWREQARVWTMDCRWRTARVAHPAHRWRRGALTAGGAPVGHPNWCPGYAADAA